MPQGVGDDVQAHDGCSGWYDALIIDERGEGEEREVKVTYFGWHSRYDQWVLAASDRLKGEDEELPEERRNWGCDDGLVDLEDGQWAVEAILKKKIVRAKPKKRRHGEPEPEPEVFYQVKWRGLDEHGKPWAPSWEPEENINQADLDAFESPPPPPPKEPYVLTAPKLVADDVADLLVHEWVEQIGRSAAALLSVRRALTLPSCIARGAACPRTRDACSHTTLGDSLPGVLLKPSYICSRSDRGPRPSRGAGHTARLPVGPQRSLAQLRQLRKGLGEPNRSLRGPTPKIRCLSTVEGAEHS